MAEHVQGRAQATQTAFALHQLAHRHWLKLDGMLIDPTGFPPEATRALGPGWSRSRDDADLRLGRALPLAVGRNLGPGMVVAHKGLHAVKAVDRRLAINPVAPMDRDQWLAQVKEEILDPELALCDSHDCFGPDRCMFESNFPVDKASCSYHVLLNAFKRLAADFAATDKAALFHDTAVRVYRLPVGGASFTRP